MSKARDLGNLAGQATGLATDSELSAAVAGIDLTNVQRIVPVDSNISVPGAPTSVSGTVGNARSTVSFVAPTDNGGSTILSYTVISSPGNIKKSGSSSPITISGLTNGTAYTFTVKAHNIAGTSVASSASSSVTPVASVTVDYLVVAGGGSGGYSDGYGGGAGGLRSTVTATGGGGTLETPLVLTLNTNYTVTVGAGATGRSNFGPGTDGSNSVFSTITSTGGGGGGGSASPAGRNGGSGGGGTPIGVGTANQGFNGADGGGGGAGTSGVTGTGNGGAGVAVAITGTSVTYAGGGGGAGGTGGAGGGGSDGASGTANTGGGGGRWNGTGNAGSGGSGVVILRYLTTDGTITIGAGLTGSTATNGSYKVTTLTAGSGNVSWA